LGKIQPELIKLVKLKSKIVDDKNWLESCKWAMRQIENNEPCILTVRRLFND